jgi:hypothetical protein
MTEYQTPPNEAKIERVYAFLSVDADGFNGIVAGLMPGLGSTPLVTASRKLAQLLIPVAQEVADRTGLKVGLYAFKREGDEDWMSE